MSEKQDLAQLRQVAEAATPGPWEVYDRGIGYEVHDANGYELNGGMRETFTEADATHITTFDPPTALALIDRLEAAENERDEAVNRAAREQAELEAEALELYNVCMTGHNLTSFNGLGGALRDQWLAVARKAREMRAEK